MSTPSFSLLDYDSKGDQDYKTEFWADKTLDINISMNAGLTGIVQIKKIMPAMNQMNAYAIRDLTQINFVQKNIHWLNKFQIQSFSKIRI